MSEKTKIQWTDSTFNPWIGCTRVGPGCDNCYAAVSTPSRSMSIKWGAGEPRHRTSASNWAQPLQWERNAQAFQAEHGRRQRVFCASLADVFDNEVPPAWRAELFALIAATPNLDWLVLTKRIGNVAKMIEAPGMQKCGLPSNVWLGATVVNQEEADRDIPKLLAVPARVRFLSIEPMLGPVDVRWAFSDASVIRCPRCMLGTNILDHGPCPNDGETLRNDPGIDWVICGGESGPSARPMEIASARRLAEQCKAAGVAFHMKQLGAQPRGWCVARLHAQQEDEADLAGDYCDLYEASECSRSCGRCAFMKDKKGGDMSEWPEDLRVREFPTRNTSA